MDDLIKRSDAIKALRKLGHEVVVVDKVCSLGVATEFIDVIRTVPSADRPKHYCAECKFKPIDKRCMPCSSCTNNPKNRDAFVSCEVEKKGADDE